MLAMESQILETKHSINADLFTTDQHLDIINFLQSHNLKSFIKPVSKNSSQTIKFYRIQSDPKIIYYNFFLTPYGELLLASSDLGVCFVSFASDKNIDELQKRFPASIFKRTTTDLHETAIDFLNNKPSSILHLHLKGTAFQLQVWESLLKITQGQLSTYKHIAKEINKPKASRAIGAAVGKNPIALIIPCHRVVRSSGIWKGFRWGNIRKATLLAYELM